MVDIAASVLIFIAYMAFAAKRTLTYLHALQQEEYDNWRFIKWVVMHRVFDKRLSLVLFGLGIVWFYLPEFVSHVLSFLCFTFFAYREKDPRKASKKKLAQTQRAKRIFYAACGMIAVSALWSFFGNHPWPWITTLHLIPLLLVAANKSLEKKEKAIQQAFWREAHEKVADLRPFVIGITGSFGKTSVKHILGHILKATAPTLITPGSVNTPMGITRIIREDLSGEHKYFVVEMGAYGVGSIEALCELTPPDMGIITAIGHAHYERFKSLEAVATAKFELAQAALNKSPDAKIVVSDQTLRFPHARDIKLKHAGNFIVCGMPPQTGDAARKETSYLEDGDLHIHRIEQLPSGLKIRLRRGNEQYTLLAPLYGRQHAHNVALAFAAAMALGIPPEDIQTALSTLPQISHRLEVRRQGAITIIDDAYNSNPLGFRSALDLLFQLKNDKRGILITPGMVELGSAHDELHEKLGAYAAEVCDAAIVVKPRRIESFIKAFRAKEPDKPLIEVETFEEASRWVEHNKRDGDFVLIENDLPDIYERIPKI